MKFLQPLILMMLLAKSDITMAQKESIDPIDWKVMATLPQLPDAEKQLGLAGPVSGVHNDALIVGGGANFPDAMPWMGGSKKYYDDVYVYTKNQGGSVVSCSKIFKLPYPTAYGASCSTPQGVVYAGGESEKGLIKNVLLIQWDFKTEDIVMKDLPELPLALANASVACHNRKLYLAGGETADAVSSAFFQLDLDDLSTGWHRLPDLPRQLSHAVALARDQGIYLIGGRKRNPGDLSTLYSSVYFFDLKSDKWIEKKPLPYRLSAGTGVSTEKSGILLFGGDKGETFHRTEALIAAISKEEDPIKKDGLNKEKIRYQSTHPGFSREILRFDTKRNEWSVTGIVPFEVPVTTTAVKWGCAVVIPSGEIKAGVRSPRILSARINKD